VSRGGVRVGTGVRGRVQTGERAVGNIASKGTS